MKLLFVDDEKAFLDTLLKRLEKRELKADAVHDGQSALSYLSENANTDVIVLDVKMPGMDGLETLEAIKNKNPLVEVIMLTGHATVENAIEGMKRGAFDYLMKPCNLEELIGKIEQAADKKSQHEQKIMQARVKEITGRMA